jgi:hypothetical protein
MREKGPCRGGNMGERDLGDIVLSWSLGEVMDDDLYRGKVIDRSSWLLMILREAVLLT